MNTPEFQEWLRRNDPESVQLVYDGPDRRQSNTLQQALTSAMDLEFEHLKANERWALNQANLWRLKAMEHEKKLESIGRYPLLRGCFYALLFEIFAVGLIWALWRLL